MPGRCAKVAGEMCKGAKVKSLLVLGLRLDNKAKKGENHFGASKWRAMRTILYESNSMHILPHIELSS